MNGNTRVAVHEVFGEMADQQAKWVVDRLEALEVKMNKKLHDQLVKNEKLSFNWLKIVCLFKKDSG